MRRALPACFWFFGLLVSASTAVANGRFPRAERLLERDGDPQRLVLAATYGLLVTDDRGGDWRHVCELGYAFSVDDIDPVVERAPGGSLLVTSAHSLNRADAPYCEFEAVLGGARDETVLDYALAPSDRNHLVAIVVRTDDEAVENELYESEDAGRTFSRLGAPFGDDVTFALTVDVAANDPNRLYISATGPDAPELFLRSDDGGTSFSSVALPIDPNGYPYIAAVDDRDPDRVYLRTDTWTVTDEGFAVGDDGLFFSDDGGSTFHEILRASGKLLGFALSPDGSEVLAAYGDPVNPSRAVEPGALGIYRASTADHVFTKIFDGSVSCLTWTENGLYVCTSEEDRGFALGFARQVDFDLATPDPLTPLLVLSDVKGPLNCPACSSVATCQASWQQTCGVFGNCDAGAPVGRGGNDDCSAGAGSGGTSATGEGGASDSGAPGSSRAGDESSCGCRTAGTRDRTGAGALFVLGALCVSRITRGRGGADARARAKRAS